MAFRELNAIVQAAFHKIGPQHRRNADAENKPHHGLAIVNPYLVRRWIARRLRSVHHNIGVIAQRHSFAVLFQGVQQGFQHFGLQIVVAVQPGDIFSLGSGQPDVSRG